MLQLKLLVTGISKFSVFLFKKVIFQYKRIDFFLGFGGVYTTGILTMSIQDSPSQIMFVH